MASQKASAKEILHWLRTYFDVPFDTIAGGHNGAIYCQIVDSMFRGKVPLNTVNFDAKSDRQIENNYKILDKVMSRCKLDYPGGIKVEKLMSGAVRESLELLQFLMFHWAQSDAVSRRYDAPKKRRKARETRYAKLGMKVPKEPSHQRRSSTSSSHEEEDKVVKPKKKRPLTARKESSSVSKGGKLPGLRLSSGVLPDATAGVRDRSTSSSSNNSVRSSRAGSPVNSVRSSKVGSPRDSMRSVDDGVRPSIASVFPEADLPLGGLSLSFMDPVLGVALVDDSQPSTGPLNEMEAKLVDLADSLAGMTLERDSYFSKLRRIEELVNSSAHPGSALKEVVDTVLMRPPPFQDDDEEEEDDDHHLKPMNNNYMSDDDENSHSNSHSRSSGGPRAGYEVEEEAFYDSEEDEEEDQDDQAQSF